MTDNATAPHEGLPTEIWLDIFRYATDIPQKNRVTPDNPFVPVRPSYNAMAANTPVLSKQTKLALLSVCRAWRPLAIQNFYEYIVILSKQRGQKLLNSLESSKSGGRPGYGTFVRHIEIHTLVRSTRPIEYFQVIFRILLLCPDVRIISGYWTLPIPDAFLEAVAKLYNSSLQALFWKETAGPPKERAPFFASFQSLRVLNFSIIPAKIVGLPRTELPTILEVVLSSNSNVLHQASCLSLPSLRRLTFSASPDCPLVEDQVKEVIDNLGKTITFLECEKSSAMLPFNLSLFLQPGVCPNLTEFVFDKSDSAFGVAMLSNPHGTLRRIGIRGIHEHSLISSKHMSWGRHFSPPKDSQERKHFRSINKSAFPALEAIRIISVLPDIAHEPSLKDLFIWWADHYEKQGIDFQDGEGVVWTFAEAEQKDPSAKIQKVKETEVVGIQRRRDSDRCRMPMY